MSKGPETKDAGERRRRRGGLRVPSDNVPRRAGSESEAVSAPVPEAVGLAASVSESFGVAGASDELDPEVEEMATIVSEPVSARLQTEDDPAAVGDSVDMTAVADEQAPPVETEEAEQEDSIESVGTELVEEDSGDVDIAMEEEVLEEDFSDLNDSMVTGEIEELTPDEDEDLEAHGIEEEPTRADITPSGEAETGESVDIPFDDGDETTITVAAPAASETPAAPKAPATPEAPEVASEPVGEELVETDFTETMEVPRVEAPVAASPPASAVAEAAAVSVPAAAPAATAAASAAPAVASVPAAPALPSRPATEPEDAGGKGKKKPRFKRALTMALNESDLEEVRTVEGEEAPAAAPKRILSPVDSGEVIDEDELEEIPEASAQSEVTAPELPAKKRPDTVEPPPPPPAQAARPTPAPAAPRPAKKPPAAAPDEKKRRRAKPWFEEIFDEDYLRTLPFLTPQATQFEANFVMESLGVEPGAQVLDVGCGYGRHAMELAARGYHVVGLDSSLPLLLRGADEAQRRGLTINFVHGDMREMTFESQFDGAYCLFSSFGYFDDETNKRTAQNIAKALKPGARFVVEVLNRDYLVADLPSRVWWEGDGCVVLEEVEFNYFSSRIVSNRSVVFDDGRQLEHEISLRSFSLHELGKFLHAVGFRVLEISGSMSTRGRFFGAHSRDIVVVAERRAKADE